MHLIYKNNNRTPISLIFFDKRLINSGNINCKLVNWTNLTKNGLKGS
jgi:hypothetical protein